MRVGFCDGCGAPLDAPWDQLVVTCGYCGSDSLPEGETVPQRVPVDGRPRLNLGGRSYVLEGRLGLGDSCTVYRGRWVVRLGERVVIKVLTALSDEDLLRREWAALSALQDSTVQGADHFVTRLPVPVAHGLVQADRPRLASVFGWKSGFVRTLSEVSEQLAGGLTGEQGVWMLKRLLELLSFVHRSGWIHGAVTPDHVLVHPKDHGAVLVGWTSAQRAGGALDAIPGRWATHYPSRRAESRTDIAMACRTVREALGSGWPAPLAAVLRNGEGGASDAWALAEQLTAASQQVYGPPAFHPIALPGWD